LLVLVLPYSLGILLLFVEQQLQVVKELHLKVNKAISPENVVINDENGKSVISINSRNILYFKSEDNYVLLYYRVDDQLKKELIRTTLKKLEQELSAPNFIRIHRSYMINSQNLVSATKTSKGYQVMMDASSKAMLPVSTTYQDLFVERCIQNPAD
jgi:DNA-binding LytR/AlgR family response regulator